MSIESTYKTFRLEKYLKEQLEQGVTPSAIELIAEAEALNENFDFSKPQFDSTLYTVEKGQEASASKFNNTFKDIIQDLNIAYKEVVSLSENALDMYERWKIESEALEKELIDIEEEIENLLLLTQDTEGYHSVLVDNFTDLLSLDMSKTTASVNLETADIRLRPSNEAEGTSIFLNNLTNEDISFRVRSSVSLRSDLVGADLRNIFADVQYIWHTVLTSNKVKPIICELIVDLGEIKSINRIEAILHDSGHAGTVTMTPLYSIDNVSYNQLPTENYSQAINKSGNFYFESTDTRYLKFILSKNAPDISSPDSYKYQFGFKQIRLYKEMYLDGEAGAQGFESKWLSVVDEENAIQEFEKLTLESCEYIPEGTSINFSVAAAASSSESPIWYNITPTNRTMGNSTLVEPVRIFDIGSVLTQEIDNIELYATNNARFKYKDPTTKLLVDAELPNESNLYSYLDSDTDGILNYLLYNEVNIAEKLPVNIRESSLVVYRGVNEWRFEEPYWYCVIENKEPTSILTGDQTLSIDDTTYPPGTVSISSGIHTIRIHKNSYNDNADSLKTLVEAAADFRAAIKMEKVSTFDLLNNVADTNYNKFALDLSLPGVDPDINTDKTVKRVFVIKKNPDNLSEKFKIKFNLINELKSYVKVKAKLETNDSSVTPSCDGYQIKLA